jgi:predicted amidohydrolase YtcJ
VVHECAGPDISSIEDLAALVARARADPAAPRVVPYWGQAAATVAEARELLAATGAHGLAGDLFVDGSLGSRTAALRTPYADAPGLPRPSLPRRGEVGAHVAACTGGRRAGRVPRDRRRRRGHLVAGLRHAARRASPAAVRARAHRVEHLEMVDGPGMATLAELGVVASVQPVFDAWWGGPSGMYVERLGAEPGPLDEPVRGPARRRGAARVRLRRAGDAARPWAAVRAAVEHRTAGSGVPQESRSPRTPPAAPRRGGALAARGSPGAGAPASYSVWELGDKPRCLRTVQDGRVLHDTL